MLLSRFAAPKAPRLLACLLVLGIMGGCQSLPDEAQSRLAGLGSIRVDAADTRLGQIFTRELNRYIRLYGTGNGTARYQLTAEFTASEEETLARLSVTYTLYDSQLGTAALADTISMTASFGGVASLYATETSRQFAHERMATQLAKRLYLRLLAYFSQNG